MPRILVVANLTLGGERLLEELRRRVAGGSTRVHVLVPAGAGASWHASDEAADRTAARARLERALEHYRELGAAEVTGEIGDPRPIEAVDDVLRREAADPFDEILLSTLPPGPSRWLGFDLPRRLQRTTSVPVTHVLAREPASA